MLASHRAGEIKAITDKSKCYDIFQKTKVNKYQMYPVRHQLDFQKYVNDTKKTLRLLQKVQVVKGLAHGLFAGYGNMIYIRMTLREIDLTK